MVTNQVGQEGAYIADHMVSIPKQKESEPNFLLSSNPTGPITLAGLLLMAQNPTRAITMPLQQDGMAILAGICA